jgi:GTP-binding protein
MFVDEVKIYARAGHGGKGCVAFLRETFRPKGGPSGGNGGRGANVILQADHDLNNLVEQFFNPRLIASNGQGGLGKGMDGIGGEDLIIKVPCGTLVWRLRDTTPPPELLTKRQREELEEQEEETDETEQPPQNAPLPGAGAHRPMLRHSGAQRAIELNLEQEDAETSEPVEGGRELVADLTKNGQQFVLCKGGRGGLGNRNFATPRRQTPRFAQPGEPGQEGEYLFELRLLAEIGLVGYPNAGKSTLLAAISKARPKIASYPFTTLHPQVGILEYPDFLRLTVCDVPGLIEGAHENVGLGHKFLRHIERCKVLVLLLDMAGTDGRKPWDDYRLLLKELELYDPALLQRRRLVVANKMDEAVAETNLKAFKRHVRKVPVLPISAAFDDSLDTFKNTIREAVEAEEKANPTKSAPQQ